MKIFKSKEKSQKAKHQVAGGRWSVWGALLFLTLCLCASVVNIHAQTTEFTYQGRLLDSTLPPTANYDFEFSLWDSLANGTQLGTTQTKTGIAVSNGIFTVRLDFGNEFPGSARFIQIAVRPAGGGAYTLLAPRQPITNVPYAVKSISADVAAVADTATTANNAQNLGGVAANQYVVTTDPRMTDARQPTAGSANYIQNTTSQQATSNFNISGDGTAGGTLSGQFVRASFGYDLFLQPFLRAVSSNSSFGFETGSANSGLANTYSGYRAGNAATSNVSNNSFFGANAGRSNSNGLNNSFFGAGSGEVNSFGGFNAFFGNNSGAANTIGNRNVFVGVTAGRDNIDGSDNVFVGGGAGQINDSGGNNSFFGSVAGTGNTTGSNNSFFGRGSGNVNVTGTFNTAIGSGANVGAGDLTFATAIGAGATVSTSNTIALGRSGGQDTVVIPGTLNVTGAINGTVANATIATTANNALNLGGVAANQYVQTTDPRMTDARTPTAGSPDYIQNQNAGAQPGTNFNVSGTGTANIFSAATQFNIGSDRVLNADGGGNVFGGIGAGTNNATGFDNSYFGKDAGTNTDSGFGNVFLGRSAGFSNTSGSFNTMIGERSNTVGGFLTNATAIGARSAVSQNNSLVLGSINGVNLATADTFVGIGTTAPQQTLHVNGLEILSTGPSAGFKFRDRGSTSFSDDWVWYSTGNVARFFRAGVGDLLTISTSGKISGDGSGLTNVTANTTTNLSLLGSLRWDLLKAQSNFAVGSSPTGVAFDGANIWVVNAGSNNVTKLRASDSALQGTFAVGPGPRGVASDGANIWVTNFGSNNVTKLRASDGALQGTFAVGSGAYGVAFDGANIWVAGFSGNNVTKLRASDGALQGTFAVGTRPSGVAFDGANIWVANINSNNVTKLRASDGALQGTFPVGINPRGVVFDGANIWVANDGSNSVTKLRANDGVVLGTFAVGTNPEGVAFDGANIWVTNIGSNNVTKLRASDGALQGTFAVGSAPWGVAFDGANIWVANGGSNVTKVPVFP